MLAVADWSWWWNLYRHALPTATGTSQGWHRRGGQPRLRVVRTSKRLADIDRESTCEEAHGGPRERLLRAVPRKALLGLPP